jgi:mannose-6-phosphate isomerase-like protein (cupin superfamily)
MGNKSHYDSAHKRVFVREISGEYSLKHELKRLRELPRVQKGGSVTFQSGPQTFSKHFMEPEDGLAQTLHIHLEEYAPGAKSQMHGHVNEAIFYILDGRGYEIHDGIKYDWKAGDIAVVHNNCVHQHNNADEHAPARALVIKTKPMYMFMNMLFQQRVTERSKEPSATQGDFVPREDADVNHPWNDEHEHEHDHGNGHTHSHAHSPEHSHSHGD